MKTDHRDALARVTSMEHCFRLLAACFYEPEKQAWDEESVFGNLQGGLDALCPRAGPLADRMAEQAGNYTDEELAVEHARLFVGPFALGAPPYGSVYLDEGGRVMGDSTMEVIQTYEQAGLTRSKDCTDLPDHIAVELEFAAFLAFKILEATKKDDCDGAAQYEATQQAFLTDHVWRWVPEFCARIRAGTDNGFYVALADCLEAVSTGLRSVSRQGEAIRSPSGAP